MTGPLSEGTPGAPSRELERLLHLARLADLGRLAASIAHEISTPLASISLCAESLSRSARDPRLQAVESFKNFPRYLKSISEEALRCKEILARLQEFARPPAEEPRPVDLNALAERAGQLLRHEMMRRRVSLELRPEAGLPRPLAREESVAQVIIALLLNAMERCPEGARVRLETSRRGAEAVSLVVADDGSGIPEEHLARIFEPFFTTKPAGAGAGLGLTVCRMIAAAHGGEIVAESESGRGSRFTLVLPLRGGKGARE